ncbi:Stearoyl-CoA 9-desaturase electron transfer partner [Roseovarius sp. THAF27]|uniref:2Fe-2S iron-sulfur cluster-binding protein n=1 Tax=Roseovarius sp. THAF27 TaxID=2587850 RepID=UPI0012682687|nr:2Fe-2S iron-sulfur cluster-binding protein [Roseovarius sp. THAF27]QFT81981.1 Stearoyl-CoA 9-desaturase electron transfer partner [Roseovarius sp. THAF27]
MLSIVNVETIKVLSGLVGTDLDPLRFRANIYINAEPFTEFTWLGRGIWTGDALLSIIRPMRRCSATSVNPNSGARDVNVPAQLMKHFGSMFCGIYANVERQGTVRRGTGVSLSEHKFPERLPAAAQVKKAPPPAEWPRSATVCAVEREAEDVISIWLEDPLVRSGSLDDLVPGQHLALHGLSQKGDWRRYTISGRREGHLRITVKRDTGVGSNFLHKLKVGQLVTISGPFGPTTLNPESRAVMLISAGIGLTPTITKLAALERSGYERSVHVIHVARSAAQLALWDEVLSMAERQPSWTTRLYLTRDTMGRPAAIEGKPDMTDLIQAAIRLEADVHMCGPTGFQRVVETVAAETGLPSDRLFFDTFASPNASTEFLPIPESGPFTVHFSKSGFSAKWSAEDGPLLDFAERNGLALPAHCRAGLCSTCRCSVIEGSARNLVSGAGNADQGVLLCCSVPVSDIVLDV